MYLPHYQKKLILLSNLLEELEKAGRDINGGKVKIERNALGDQFCFIKDGNAPRDLFQCRALQSHSADQKPNKESLENADDSVLALFPEGWGDEHPVSSDGIGVFEFANHIGYDNSHARYLIDVTCASRLPSFSAVTLTNTRARKFTEDFGGLYYLYRHDRNRLVRKPPYNEGVLVRATLSIRYPVPIKSLDSNKKGHSRIRCKLNLPAYDQDKLDGAEADIYKYDGYVSSKGKWWQWIFQVRQSDPPRKPDLIDLMLMYTEIPSNIEGFDILKGVMMTQNQGADLRPTVSSLVLIREPEYSVRYRDELKSYDLVGSSDNSDEKDFMRNNSRILDLGNKIAWKKHDEMAMLELFKGWDKINFRGLHI